MSSANRPLYILGVPTEGDLLPTEELPKTPEFCSPEKLNEQTSLLKMYN
jgi:hypothetical protein